MNQKNGDKSVIKWIVRSQNAYETDTLENAARTFEILF